MKNPQQMNAIVCASGFSKNGKMEEEREEQRKNMYIWINEIAENWVIAHEFK